MEVSSVEPHSPLKQAREIMIRALEPGRTSALARTFAALTVAGVLAACSGSPTTDLPQKPGALRLSIDNSTGTALSVAPKAATLVYGTGTFLKAQVVDASGQLVVGARASWRSTNPSSAIVAALADSGLASDYGRAVISSIAPGTALIIASYEGLADTAVITIIARTDSIAPVPRPQPPRAREFDLTVRVWGTEPSVPAADSANRYPRIAGAKVTVTLLPLLPGDSVDAGTFRVTEPTVAGTLVTDVNGQVKFTRLPVTRFQLSVEPPAASPWANATQTAGLPYLGDVFSFVMLQKR